MILRNKLEYTRHILLTHCVALIIEKVLHRWSTADANDYQMLALALTSPATNKRPNLAACLQRIFATLPRHWRRLKWNEHRYHPANWAKKSEDGRVTTNRLTALLRVPDVSSD